MNFPDFDVFQTILLAEVVKMRETKGTLIAGMIEETTRGRNHAESSASTK